MFRYYQPDQQEALKALYNSPEWSEVIGDAGVLDHARAGVRTPPAPPSQVTGIAPYLEQNNGPRVRLELLAGARDAEGLAHEMGSWQHILQSGEDFPILFLGLVLTMDCSFRPRCLYCNQGYLPTRMKLDDWIAVLGEAARPIPPYVYLTGGEPLALGEEVWGDNGIADTAAKLGCAVNINTNATLITPLIALQLVRMGISKLHISMDTADTIVQDELFGAPGRAEAAWRGIANIQIAREILGVNHPVIHINCVLSSRNLFQFPALLKRLLEVRKTRSKAEGPIQQDPVFGDFAFHLIPIGGLQNDGIRPTAGEWRRFYTETWDQAEAVWRDYQTSVGILEADHKSLERQMPFANPFRRVDHRMTLDEYCEEAARGVYWRSALASHCYLGPSQAFVLPDGSQHWCGGHAIRRPAPIGNVLDASLRQNIRQSAARLAALPTNECTGCAGATCVINQSIETTLVGRVTEWLNEG